MNDTKATYKDRLRAVRRVIKDRYKNDPFMKEYRMSYVRYLEAGQDWPRLADLEEHLGLRFPQEPVR